MITGISIIPTVECLGVTVSYTGTTTSRCLLEYRTTGGVWKKAQDPEGVGTLGMMWNDTLHKQHKASIFFLKPNTTYEVRATHADGTVTGSATTWNDNPPIGSTVVITSGTTITQSGTPTAWIQYTGNTVLNNSVIVKASYVKLKGLKFANTTGSSVLISGESIAANSVHDVIVEDCVITNPDTSNTGTQGAIRIDYGAGKCIIQRNIVHMNNPNAVEDKSAFVWWKPGYGLNSVFRDNIVDGTTWDGFGGGPEDTEEWFNDCDFYRNKVTGALDDSIQLDGGNRNVRCWDNKCLKGFQGPSLCPNLLGPAYVFENTVEGVMTRTLGDGGLMKLGDMTVGRTYVFDNTMVATQNGVDGPFATNGGLENIFSRNNIWSASWYMIEFGHQADAVNHNFDYDYIATNQDRGIKWDQATYSKTQVQNGAWTSDTGMERHGILSGVDPQFTDPANKDFTLKPTSPLIGKGVILPGFNDADSPWPYKGTAPDIGAHEYSEGGNTMATSGAVSAQAVPGETITIKVTRPTGEVDIMTALTDANRNYSATYTATIPGNYTAQASIEEDATYTGAVSPIVTFSVGKLPRTITLVVT